MHVLVTIDIALWVTKQTYFVTSSAIKTCCWYCCNYKGAHCCSIGDIGNKSKQRETFPSSQFQRAKLEVCSPIFSYVKKKKFGSITSGLCMPEGKGPSNAGGLLKGLSRGLGGLLTGGISSFKPSFKSPRLL